MSARSRAAYAAITGVRASFQALANGLRQSAGPEVLAKAAAKVQAQVDAVSKKYVGKHTVTGAGLASLNTTASGGLVQLHSIGYLRYHGWNPFRGSMPPFVLRWGLRVFAAEVRAAIFGGATLDAGALVEIDAVEADVAKQKANRTLSKVRRRLARLAKKGGA